MGLLPAQGPLRPPGPLRAHGPPGPRGAAPGPGAAPAAASGRVWALSDVHTDMAENMEWCRRLARSLPEGASVLVERDVLVGAQRAAGRGVAGAAWRLRANTTTQRCADAPTRQCKGNPGC